MHLQINLKYLLFKNKLPTDRIVDTDMYFETYTKIPVFSFNRQKYCSGFMKNKKYGCLIKMKPV